MNVETLEKYLDAGFRLCPTRQKEAGGALIPMLYGDAYKDAGRWISTAKGILEFKRRGMTGAMFRPSDLGWACFDLDEKGGRHGIRSFFNTIRCEIWDACCVATPHGGLHVYFINDAGLDFKADCGSGIETKAGKRCLTCAGSEKDGVEYRLLGGGLKPRKTTEFCGWQPFVKARRAARTAAVGVARDVSFAIGKISDADGHHANQIKFCGICLRTGVAEAEAEQAMVDRPDLFGDDIRGVAADIYRRYR